MSSWPDRRALDLFGIEHPILQAPMAGANTSTLALAVSGAGGLGGLPCATLAIDKAREEMTLLRASARPYNVNFFCHRAPVADAQRDAAWKAKVAPYYAELGLDVDTAIGAASRRPFDAAMCDLVVEFAAPVVSFHFGLPERDLVDRVHAAGSKIVGSATTVEEARWLEDHGADAIVAQGYEAGGHRGMFLATDVDEQPGTFALVPRVVDAVSVPVIAAGGIADARGVVAALALGAAAAQLGTAYLYCPEASISPLFRKALAEAGDATVITNVFTGRPARGIANRFVRELGPMAEDVPAFPLGGAFSAPLRTAAESRGSTDFTNLWAGQAASLGRALPAGDLTQTLAAEALALLGRLGKTT